MLKILCDKCDKEMKNNYGYDTVIPNVQLKNERYMLCDKCIEMIKVWLKDKK